jgi:hypothetical protein
VEVGEVMLWDEGIGGDETALIEDVEHEEKEQKLDDEGGIEAVGDNPTELREEVGEYSYRIKSSCEKWETFWIDQLEPRASRMISSLIRSLNRRRLR